MLTVQKYVNLVCMSFQNYFFNHLDLGHFTIRKVSVCVFAQLCVKQDTENNSKTYVINRR